jgi:hypothetical protein
MRERWPSRLVVLAAAVVYAVTAARTVVGGDNGEFVAVAAAGGVPHPPGYPLYVLYLRATQWIPARSPAHAAALATTILGVAAVVVLQRACRAWGASREAGAIASAAFAFSWPAWTLATHADVLMLGALLALAIVALCAPSSGAMGGRRVFVLGLLAGLGLSDHHSIVALAPLGLWAAVNAARASRRPAAAAALGVAGLALGLTPYAYLLFEARAPDLASSWRWGHTGTVHGLVHHFLRADYGTTELALGAKVRAPADQLAALANALVLGMVGLPLAALAGGARALARRPGIQGRGYVVALVLSFVLAGPAFVAWLNVPLAGLGQPVVDKFYLLPAALIAVLSALGLDALAPALRSRSIHGGAAAALVGAIAAACAVPRVRETNRPDVERYARDILRLAAPGAIIVGDGDHRFHSFLYARYALRERPDVVFIDASLMLSDWYPPIASRLLGFPVEGGRIAPGHDRPSLDTVALVTALARSGRQVYLTNWFAGGLDTHVPSFPVGPLLVITPPGAVPPPEKVLELNLAAERRMAPAGDPPESERTWQGDLADDYARPWLALARAFRTAGRDDLVRACLERARARAPWTPES